MTEMADLLSPSSAGRISSQVWEAKQGPKASPVSISKHHRNGPHVPKKSDSNVLCLCHHMLRLGNPLRVPAMHCWNAPAFKSLK